jgi:23S rRNA (adenine2503-C2)-methyltransferase
MEKTAYGSRRLLTGMTHRELLEWFTGELGMKAFRADQVFTWVHQKRVDSFGSMTNISKETRRILAELSEITTLGVHSASSADDGTCKTAFTLRDGSVIESVLIPDPPRLTACISSQVGCRWGCIFCQTGKMGLKRDLTPDEIVAQLYQLQSMTQTRITNVVFMGMGEPLENFDNLSSAISIISDDRGICIGARKITVSTVGIPGGIRKLCGLGRQYGLAVSLHSAVESTRRYLVPASRALPLVKLAEDLKYYNQVTGRRVTLEYCLIAGINDSEKEAEALCRFSKAIQCKINLLVYNPIEGVQLQRPDKDEVRAFMDYLYPRCQAVTLRRSRGTEISAACGQLGTGNAIQRSE